VVIVDAGPGLARGDDGFTSALSMGESVEERDFASLELVEADLAGSKALVERVQGVEHVTF
jgi:hypothetical protein